MISSTCLVVVTVTIIATMYTGKGTELDDVVQVGVAPAWFVRV